MYINEFLKQFVEIVELAFGGTQLFTLIVSAVITAIFLCYTKLLFKNKIILLFAFTVYVIMNLAEIVIIHSMFRDDPVWYLSSFSAFFRGVIALIIASLTLPFQYRFLSLICHAINHHGGYCASNECGCLAYILSIVGGMISLMITDSNIPMFVIFGVLQLAQLYVMFDACHKSHGNYLMIIPSFLLFFLGIGEILYIVTRLLGIAIFLFAFAFFFQIVGNGQEEEGVASNLIGEDSIRDGYGGTVYGTRIDRDNFFGGGNHWVRHYDGLTTVWKPAWGDW